MNQVQYSDILSEIILQTEQLIEDGYYDHGFSQPNLPSLQSILSDFVIMGEIKPGSPSQGRMFNKNQLLQKISQIAPIVDAISVITEPNYFFGHLDNLDLVKSYRKPVLMKDFIVSERQIFGANSSTILLIKRILSDDQLSHLLEVSSRNDREVLLEVDNENDFVSSLDTNADLIAINNRNLETMNVDISKSKKFLQEYQPDIPVFALSGYRSVESIIEIHNAGAAGVLIGTILSQLSDPTIFIKQIQDKLEELI